MTTESRVVANRRHKWEDEHYTKQIDCPEHPGQHTATLYQFGHRYAGIWECPVTGDTDSHDCQEFKTETAINTYWSQELEDTIDAEVAVEVCVGCGVAQEQN
jgi:hypothetical protein